MPRLLFLSKLAFICNICYALGFLVRADLLKPDPHFWPMILLAGYLPGILFNFIVNLAYLFRIIVRKGFDKHPGWLVITNLIFLLFQLADLLFL